MPEPLGSRLKWRKESIVTIGDTGLWAGWYFLSIFHNSTHSLSQHAYGKITLNDFFCFKDRNWSAEASVSHRLINGKDQVLKSGIQSLLGVHWKWTWGQWADYSQGNSGASQPRRPQLRAPGSIGDNNNWTNMQKKRAGKPDGVQSQKRERIGRNADNWI